MTALSHFQGRKGGSVFVDRLAPCRRSVRWKFSESCHLFTLPSWEDDLHEFAASIGLQRRWYQLVRTMPHYDLSPGRRLEAVRLGAIEVDRREVVEAIRSWREASRMVLEQSLASQRERDREILGLFKEEEFSNVPVTVEEFSLEVAKLRQGGRRP